MTSLLSSFSHWLLDVYLLSSLLLVLAMTALLATKQPAKRRVVTHSTLVGLILLTTLCALPGWSLISLASRPAPIEQPRSLPTNTATTLPVPLESISPLPIVTHEPVLPIETVPQQTTPATTPFTIPSIPWAALAVLVWISGNLLIATRLALGWYAARCLLRRSQLAPPTLHMLLQEFLPPSAKRISPELRTSEQIDVAVALGLTRPTILLPASWLATQSQEELRTVLAHEAAHLRSRDLHWLATSRVLAILLWAQPLFWFVCRRMRLDQELLADAAAAELTSRQHYAEKLVALAHQVRPRNSLHLSTAVGLWEGPSQLRRRIAILLDDRFAILRTCPNRWRLSATVLALCTTVVLSLITFEQITPAKAAPQKEEKKTTETVKPAADSAKPAEKPPIPMVTVSVRIVDEEGKPIEGVTIEQHSYQKTDATANIEPATPSNAQGVAKFPYPKFATERLGVKDVYVTVRHPEFVTAQQNVNIFGKPSEITLKRGGTIDLHAHTTSNSEPVFPVYAIVPRHGLLSPWIKSADGSTQSPQLPADEQSHRFAYFPDGGPALFSDAIQVSVVAGQSTPLKVELRPGMRIEGTIDPQVPRPVRDGRVMLSMVIPDENGWADWTTVAEDGSFVFESLPPIEQAEFYFAAVCDGFVSQINEDSEAAGMMTSVKLKKQDVTKPFTLPMSPAAHALVITRDHRNKPIPGVKVVVQPGMLVINGTSGFGYLTSTKKTLTTESGIPAFNEETFLYQAVTNDEGEAEIRNLPPFRTYVVAYHEEYELPANPLFGVPIPLADLRLEAGKTSRRVLTMLRTQPIADNPAVGNAAALAPVIASSPDQKENEPWEHGRHELVPILGPLTSGGPPVALDPPSDDEVMRALEKIDAREGGARFVGGRTRENVRIVKEKIADYVDPPRVYPLIGPAQQYHAHYKCTVYYDEHRRVGGQPIMRPDVEEVIYIDHNHLHMVDDANTEADAPLPQTAQPNKSPDAKTSDEASSPAKSAAAADRVVGTVYAKNVTAKDIGLVTPIDSTMQFDARDKPQWELMGRIATRFGKPVLDRFVDEQKIEVTDDEVQQFQKNTAEARKKQVRENEERLKNLKTELAKDDLSDTQRKLLQKQQQTLEKTVAIQDEQKTLLTPDGIARQLIHNWKIERELHRKYGGRVIFQQFGLEALDGRRKLYEEAEKNGNLTFNDPGVRHLFYYYSTQLKHTTIDEDALEKPWFFGEAPMAQ